MTRCPICNRLILFGGHREGDQQCCSQYCAMRVAELEGRDLSAQERRLWIASSGTRCWVCGSTIYGSTGIFDDERRYCSRACFQRAADLNAKFGLSESPEKRGPPTGDGQARFAAAIVQLGAQQKGIRRPILIPSVLLLSLPLLLWLARTAHMPRVGIWLILTVVVSLVLLLSFAIARKVDEIEKAYGVKCPQCKRYFRGSVLVHALKTGRCMHCGGTVFHV